MGINLVIMSEILAGAGSDAAKAFSELYNLWFDSEGNKTQYLRIQELDGITFAKMLRILNGTGSNAAKTYKDLYNRLSDNHIRYLRINATAAL